MSLRKVQFAMIVVLAFGLAGSGLSFLAHRTNAHPPSTALSSLVNSNDGRTEVLAPATARTDAPAQPNPNDLAQKKAAPILRDLLGQEINYSGCDDPRATLSDLLEQLSKRYNLTFDVNEKAFEMDQLKEVERIPVADPMPIPPMRATLSTVLRRILRRVPASSGATYLIRRDVIEITTGTAVHIELGIPASRPLLPLVGDTLQNTPIAAALRQLAHQSDYNIVVDPRIADKLQVPVSAEFNNVPLDTAVRLLANMAGMNMVQLDNVLYVTTSGNAKGMDEEQTRINQRATPIP